MASAVDVARESALARPARIGRRGLLLLAIGIAGAAAWAALGLSPADLSPGAGGLRVLGLFLRGAVSPAWTYEAAAVPEGAPPLLLKAAAAARSTILFAAAGMSLALVFGVTLGFLGATSWWSDEAPPAAARRRRRLLFPALYGAVRVVIAGMRSVHELLWAVLFLAAFGLNSLSAVVAIAIPYGGTLAKVFSEMIDECPRDSARGLRAIGGSRAQVFLFGLVPRALAEMFAYAFYRFECAVRSSAVLGFFGYPTIGYYLRLSAENLHYREVWTYLYALFAIILVFELWSGALRRRVVLR